MKKASAKKNSSAIQNEYDFDYTKAKPNRFVNLVREKTILIPLEEDVAKIFNTPSEVNKALRAIINAIPKKISKKRKHAADTKQL